MIGMNKVKAYFNFILKFLISVLAVSACSGIGELNEDIFANRDFPVILTTSRPYADTKVSLDGTVVAWEQDDRIQLTAVASDNSTGSSELTFIIIYRTDFMSLSFIPRLNMTRTESL